MFGDVGRRGARGRPRRDLHSPGVSGGQSITAPEGEVGAKEAELPPGRGAVGRRQPRTLGHDGTAFAEACRWSLRGVRGADLDELDTSRGPASEPTRKKALTAQLVASTLRRRVFLYLIENPHREWKGKEQTRLEASPATARCAPGRPWSVNSAQHLPHFGKLGSLLAAGTFLRRKRTLKRSSIMLLYSSISSF